MKVVRSRLSLLEVPRLTHGGLKHLHREEAIRLLLMVLIAKQEKVFGIMLSHLAVRN